MDASFLYLLSVIDYTEVTAITERNAVLRRHNTITGKPSAVNTERETVKTSAVRTNICLTPHKKTHNSVSVCQASVELALIAFVLLFLCYSVFLPSSSLVSFLFLLLSVPTAAVWPDAYRQTSWADADFCILEIDQIIEITLLFGLFKLSNFYPVIWFTVI